MFKLDDREDGGGWFYIVKFKANSGVPSVTKVKDIFNDHSCKHLLIKRFL